MSTPHELLAARITEKIEAGKRPSKSDLEWLAALEPPAPTHSSVEKSRNAKGETQITVKVYAADPLEAESLSNAIYDRQRARYPMLDGTVGSPVVES